MVLAYLQHHPGTEIASLAKELPPNPDPETNYLSATHLAYVGETGAALAMLKRAVEENYCSYPGMDSDPLLVGIRSKPAFAEIREAGKQCHEKFLRDRAVAPTQR